MPDGFYVSIDDGALMKGPYKRLQDAKGVMTRIVQRNA